MAYNPISGFTLQVITQTGEVASDYYLKFYQANTTTPLSMATDSAGGTLLAKAKLSDSGFPISNPLDNSTVFIPHMNANYRLVVYTSEADADADNTAAAYVNIPFVSTLVGASAVGTAAYLDTGTGAANVPTNGDLGTAAFVNTGTGPADVPTNADLPTFGTAATADVQTSPTDTTAGRLMAVGAFGLGASGSELILDINSHVISGLFRVGNFTVGNHIPQNGVMTHKSGFSSNSARQTIEYTDSDVIVSRRKASGVWQAWRTINTSAT